MNLIDVHAHLDFSPLKDNLHTILANAKQAGVKVIITNGVDAGSNREVLRLSKEHDIVKCALGFYPTHIQEVSQEEFDKEIAWIVEQKPIALGEIGLDYKFSSEEHPDGMSEEQKKIFIEKQKYGFKKFIVLSEKLNIPLIIHSRKAEEDVIELLEQSKAKKIIMHCFSGKRKLVQRIQKNGWTFSVPVIVTKLEQFQELVKTTPLSQLLTETDAPYLGPQPGLTNEPANVSLTIKKIAEIKGMTENEVADQIFMNYMRLFL